VSESNGQPIDTSYVGVKLVEQYLDEYGWKAHSTEDEPHEKEGIVRTGWVDGNGRTNQLIIDPIIERGLLGFIVPGVADARPSTTSPLWLRDLLMVVSYRNYRALRGKWAYDPRDGEVSFRHHERVADGLTFEAFEELMGIVLAEIGAFGEIARAVAEGKRPASEIFEQWEVIPG
jgi:hypothetical protein